MANYTVTDTELTSIADAIRAKGGTSADLEYPQGFVTAIEAIDTSPPTPPDPGTEDATLSSGGEMLAGVTAYAKGVKYTGTIPSKQAAIYTPTTNNQVISSGQYLAGDQTVLGDQNLLSENIANGVSIFGVAGTMPMAELDDAAVKFIDYDGTLLYQYTKSQVDAMTVLPANPQHERLIAQGWNWTLAEIRTQLAAMPGQTIWVGQLYETASHGFEMDFDIDTQDLCSMALYMCIRGSMLIDWGDGSAKPSARESMTNTSNNYYYHTYAEPGSYTITIYPEFEEDIGTNDQGYVRLNGSNDSGRYQNLIIGGQSPDGYSGSVYNSINRAYYNAIKRVRLGPLDTISSYAFSNCPMLESITFPRKDLSLDYTFGDMKKLKSITIPTASSVSYNIFSYAEDALETVSIPYGATGGIVFTEAQNLRGICSQAASTYSGQFNSKKLKKVYVPPLCSSISSFFIQYSGVEEVVLHDNIVSIGSSSFSYSNIKSIKIPDSVTSIGTSAFSNCYFLQSVELPSSITSIASMLFYNCRSLSYVKMPNALTTIGDNAFYDTAIQSITIPSGVTTIGKNALKAFCLCTVYSLPTSPPTINTSSYESTFYKTGTSYFQSHWFKIYVPYSSDHSVLAAYKSATGWSEFADFIVEMPEQ